MSDANTPIAELEAELTTRRAKSSAAATVREAMLELVETHTWLASISLGWANAAIFDDGLPNAEQAKFMVRGLAELAVDVGSIAGQLLDAAHCLRPFLPVENREKLEELEAKQESLN
jgi:hypothetical protein